VKRRKKMNFKYKQRKIILGALTVILLAIGLIPISTAVAPIVLSISEVQGDGFESPYTGQSVITTGIVTADYQSYNQKRGFYLQDPVGDGNPATSDGVFVYHYSYDVEVGDEISISGKPSEYYGCTQFYKPWITMISKGNPIPEPVELNPPFDDYASDVYYEAHEGMIVSVSSLKVVAGTNQYGEVAGVRVGLGVNRVFEDDPRGTGELIFTDDAGGYVINTRTGTLLKNLLGPLDYSYDEYKVLPSADAPPEIVPEWRAESQFVRPLGFRFGFTVATYNMYNLFDEIDTPIKEDPVYDPEEVELQLTKHALAIRDYLREPVLIAVQEVENLEVLERLANTPPIAGKYGSVLIDGPDFRGIDVGLLYRKDRVTILSAEARQTCTDLEDEYGPGTDPNYPCEEGYNPLFSRPPLVVHLETQKYGRGWKTTELWIIINHFKSKGVYAPTYADPEPRRIQQAEWVNNLVTEIQDNDKRAKIIVLGDLNSFEAETPIKTLENAGLKNLISTVNKRSRYTYIYRGVSEVLDYIMTTKSLKRAFLKARVLHFNVDFPAPLFSEDSTTGIRTSDHDIFTAVFWL
jgi:predicted extracellular nuclease